MTLASVIVDQALKLCNESSQLLTTDPYMQQEGFTQLVDMLITMRGDGLYVTPQIPAAITAELKEIPEAKRGLIFDLAEAVAPFIQTKEFVRSFDKQQKKAHKTMYIAAKPPTNQRLPETLPSGSGNDYCSWWSSNFYARHDNTAYKYYESPNNGEAFLYVADFDSDATKSGTTVSSVVWSVEQGTAVISNTSTVSNASTSLITFNTNGTVKIKARAAYANSEIRDFDFLFQVNPKVGNIA